MGHQDEQMFAILRTQIPITIEEYPDAEPSTLLELSETNAKFECAFQIADGTNLTFHSAYLEGFFKHNVKLKGSVIFQEKKGPDQYETDIFFKGLSEQDRQELRSVTTTKRELIEKDNEQEEEGESEENSEEESSEEESSEEDITSPSKKKSMEIEEEETTSEEETDDLAGEGGGEE